MKGGWNKMTLVTAIVAAVLGSSLHAQEVSWIKGESVIDAWSVYPVSPTEADVIYFSGPTDGYQNRCSAEEALGGEPMLAVDSKSMTVELFFQPPASRHFKYQCPRAGPTAGANNGSQHGNWN